MTRLENQEQKQEGVVACISQEAPSCFSWREHTACEGNIHRILVNAPQSEMSRLVCREHQVDPVEFAAFVGESTDVPIAQVQSGLPMLDIVSSQNSTRAIHSGTRLPRLTGMGGIQGCIHSEKLSFEGALMGSNARQSVPSGIAVTPVVLAAKARPRGSPGFGCNQDCIGEADAAVHPTSANANVGHCAPISVAPKARLPGPPGFGHNQGRFGSHKVTGSSAAPEAHDRHGGPLAPTAAPLQMAAGARSQKAAVSPMAAQADARQCTPVKPSAAAPQPAPRAQLPGPPGFGYNKGHFGSQTAAATPITAHTDAAQRAPVEPSVAPLQMGARAPQARLPGPPGFGYNQGRFGSRKATASPITAYTDAGHCAPVEPTVAPLHMGTKAPYTLLPGPPGFGYNQGRFGSQKAAANATITEVNARQGAPLGPTAAPLQLTFKAPSTQSPGAPCPGSNQIRITSQLNITPVAAHPEPLVAPACAQPSMAPRRNLPGPPGFGYNKGKSDSKELIRNACLDAAQLARLHVPVAYISPPATAAVPIAARLPKRLPGPPGFGYFGSRALNPNTGSRAAPLARLQLLSAAGTMAAKPAREHWLRPPGFCCLTGLISSRLVTQATAAAPMPIHQQSAMSPAAA